MSRGNTDEVRSLGKGREHRKLLLDDGIEDDDANSRLYDEMLEFAWRGEV